MTRLKNCVYIVVPTHVETIVLLKRKDRLIKGVQDLQQNMWVFRVKYVSGYRGGVREMNVLAKVNSSFITGKFKI